MGQMFINNYSLISFLKSKMHKSLYATTNIVSLYYAAGLFLFSTATDRQTKMATHPDLFFN